ncbi:hypothetical protein AXF42_Ash010775 [Apostasia shenzhenica]|uniref:AP-3 complex subunit delta domain-containing protein n=1 Tax=Apostasia shenzhenica TaxID=1088818 RepID=A0A2I0A0M0_9ASPA|nr:hypothetical protein AXF42_Ash010775 [Apostasia shenzhenica]
MSPAPGKRRIFLSLPFGFLSVPPVPLCTPGFVGFRRALKKQQRLQLQQQRKKEKEKKKKKKKKEKEKEEEKNLNGTGEERGTRGGAFEH